MAEKTNTIEKKSISQIKDEEQKKLSALFDEFGIFFAFSQEQLKEGIKEGVKYIKTDFGMFCPKDNWEIYNKRFEQLLEETKKEYEKYSSLDEYIAYQLGNYEAYYTWLIDDAYNAVKVVYPECTKEDMWRVFKATLKNHDPAF